MTGVRTVGGALTVGGLVALAGRYAAGAARADRHWAALVQRPLSGLAEVDQLTVLPLVERLTAGDRLLGEAGLSYVIRAGAVTLIFDTGLNLRGVDRPALVQNAATLGIDLQGIDGVVISHAHADHVGGPRMMRRHTFGFSPDPLEPRGLPAYVPASELSHDRADVVPTTGPRVIAPGVAVLPPLPAAMFLLGPVLEQALLVNVRGFGLVVITGCGHPPIERILALTEKALDVPIRGVVGGLHLPVHPWGTPLIPQAVLGNPHWPWQPISEHDATAVIDASRARGPRIVALSGHDSTPWTFTAFERCFGDRYRTLRVGEPLHVDAAS